MKVTKIEFKEYDGPVYNLEVEEDNTYICENFTLHNCSDGVNPDKDIKMDIVNRLNVFLSKQFSDNETVRFLENNVIDETKAIHEYGLALDKAKRDNDKNSQEIFELILEDEKKHKRLLEDRLQKILHR